MLVLVISVQVLPTTVNNVASFMPSHGIVHTPYKINHRNPATSTMHCAYLQVLRLSMIFRVPTMAGPVYSYEGHH